MNRGLLFLGLLFFPLLSKAIKITFKNESDEAIPVVVYQTVRGATSVEATVDKYLEERFPEEVDPFRLRAEKTRRLEEGDMLLSMTLPPLKSRTIDREIPPNNSLFFYIHKNQGLALWRPRMKTIETSFEAFESEVPGRRAVPKFELCADIKNPFYDSFDFLPHGADLLYGMDGFFESDISVSGQRYTLSFYRRKMDAKPIRLNPRLMPRSLRRKALEI